MDILGTRKTAIFCSTKCPGGAILAATETARQVRDSGVTVISGFHSPVEKECLRILLKGRQPIIICPARALESMRIPAAWRSALDAGRLLILSQFSQSPRRPTVETARQRNDLVAALADNALVIHATPGGETARIPALLKQWKVPNVELANG
jgi:predicted Rossmann fold nucleotide-binding protein DprA/Smf involved in DNA uptake